MKKESSNIISVKKEVMNLSTVSWQEHIKNLKPLNETIFDRLKEVSNDIIFADSTGVELSGNKFLTASILFKDLLKKDLKVGNIAILMPCVSAGAFINYTVLMMGKKVINLNYTSEINSLKSSINLAEIKSIITSKKFVEKLESKGINIKEVFDGLNIIYMEDLKEKISKTKGLITYLSVRFLPSFLLKLVHLTKTSKDETVMILFSSGSEGTPKGVCIS